MEVRSYKFLEQVFKKICDIDEAVSVLSSSDYQFRALRSNQQEQIFTLEEIKYEVLSNEVVAEAFQHTQENKGSINNWETANFLRMRKLHLHYTLVPFNLLMAFKKAQNESYKQWLLAKKNESTDFKDYISAFSQCLQLKREIAALKSSTLKMSKYNTLLDEQDDGIGTKELDSIFTDVGDFYRKFVKDVMAYQRKNKILPLKNLSTETAKGLNEACLNLLKVSMEQVKNYAHELDDCENINVEKSDRSKLLHTLMILFKLCSHVLYNTSLPSSWVKQPVGNVCGRVMFDAQALLMSDYIAKSHQFVTFIHPYFKKGFSLRGKSNASENLQAVFNRVEPNLFLNYSDQVTRIAHIMLRYSLERELIEGELEVQDLEAAWADGIKHYFNLTVPDISASFTQDGLWAGGNFGVIPFKVVSDIAAAKLFSTMQKNNESVMKAIEKGDFSLLIQWLQDCIYKHGHKSTSLQLLDSIAGGGKGLDVELYKSHLHMKYLPED